MTLTVVHSRGLVDQVFDQLATEIMSGSYPAGSPLPSERALAEAFSVNRQVVREASRRLAQMGLVQVLHGDGTRVLDFRTHGGLDLLALMIERQSGGSREPSFWLPILELRSALAPDVVRLCTKRATQALRNELLHVAEQMSRAPDTEQLYVLERRFWELIHEGADHLVYRFTYNSFMRCADSSREQSKAWAALEVQQAGYRIELAKAIAAGDAAKAEREIRNTMRATLEIYEAEALKRRPRKPTSKVEARAASALRSRADEPRAASALRSRADEPRASTHERKNAVTAKKTAKAKPKTRPAKLRRV